MIKPELLRKIAYSVENRAGHGADHLELTEIYKEHWNGAVYTYYQDSEGDYWYHSTIGADLDELIKNERKILPGDNGEDFSKALLLKLYKLIISNVRHKIKEIRG